MADRLTKNIDADSCLSEQLILDYLSNKLDKTTQRKVEMHMHHCILCSDAVEGLGQIKSSDHSTTILSDQRRNIDKRTKGTNEYLLRTSLVAASLLLICLSVLFFIYNKKENKSLALESPVKISQNIPKQSAIRLPDAVSSDAAIADNDIGSEIKTAAPKSKLNFSRKQDDYPKTETITNEVEKNESARNSASINEENQLKEITDPIALPAPSIAQATEEKSTQEARKEEVIAGYSSKKNIAENESLRASPAASDKQGTTDDDLLYEGEIKFHDKDYAAASVLLEKFLQNNHKNAKALYLSGICEINLKQYNKALDKLHKIQKHSLYFDEAQYYLAIANIEIGNKTEAKNILDLMIKRDINKTKAIELEKSIR